MKIKVGNIVYDGEKEPIMVILTESDKKNIKNMPGFYTKYCQCPDTCTPEEMARFMRT